MVKFVILFNNCGKKSSIVNKLNDFKIQSHEGLIKIINKGIKCFLRAQSRPSHYE